MIACMNPARALTPSYSPHLGCSPPGRPFCAAAVGPRAPQGAGARAAGGMRPAQSASSSLHPGSKLNAMWVGCSCLRSKMARWACPRSPPGMAAGRGQVTKPCISNLFLFLSAAAVVCVDYRTPPTLACTTAPDNRVPRLCSGELETADGHPAGERCAPRVGLRGLQALPSGSNSRS
jgi:hypothetical protein